MLSKYLPSAMLFLSLLFFSCQRSFSDAQSALTDNVINACNYCTIQEAVSAIPDEGGTVFIPAGIYNISEPIIIDKSDVTLMGAGSGTILLNTSEEGKNTIELKGEEGEGKSIWRIQVSNMHLKGNEDCGHAIYASYVNEIFLNEMWIDYHGKTGLYLYHCTENPRISDNNIAYNKENGVFIDGCHDVVISANQMEENRIGIYLQNVWNATITGNNIDDHFEYCIYCDKVLGSIITANMLENSKNICMLIDEECSGITVTGNILRRPGDLRIIKTRGITITGNTFEMTRGNSIEVENSNLITISGNIISDGGPIESYQVYGMVLKDVSDVSIGDNTLVKPLEGGIYVLGNKNQYINISCNTIKNSSTKSPNKFSGIYIQNTTNSIISNNIIIDDQGERSMRSAIEEAGNSDFNMITSNRVNKGLTNDILINGSSTKQEGNLVH
jgi:parallel beta-helix repeat protein